MKGVVGLGVVSLALTPIVACGPTAEPSRSQTTVLARIGDIAIDDGYAPEPVTVDVGVLYFTIHNDAAHPDSLRKVSVDIATDVSLHAQERSGASMRMVPIESIMVPANGTVSLAPGGLHAMLRDLQFHYRQGDSLTVTAEFATAGTVTFVVPVIVYADVADRIAHDDRD